MHVARRLLPWILAAFVGCCLVQVFLAGLGVFDDPSSFITHREFGYTFGWLTLVALVVAIAGRQSRLLTGLAALLLVQMALQSILVAMREAQPAVAALHPVNGFLLVLVATWAFRLARVAAREDAAAAAEPAGAPTAAREPAR